MSIFTGADFCTMSLHWGDNVEDREAELAMRLMEDGVPLRLLVDIALPMGLIRELYDDTDRASQR
jgi:hypothetical protein